VTNPDPNSILNPTLTEHLPVRLALTCACECRGTWAGIKATALQ